MFQSNITFFLKTRIPVTHTTGGTFTISEDNERKLPIDTEGKQVTLILKTRNQIERFVVTIALGVCTIVKCGLNQNGGVQIPELKKEWIEGANGYITALDFDLIDKDGEEQTVSAPLNFDSRVTLTNVKLPTFTNTTLRDAEYTSPVNGDKCFVVGVGEQVYNSGAWITLGEGTPTPNASETVAGKVEIATNAQVTTGTTIGETGAILTPTLPQIKNSIALKNTDTAIAENDFIVFSDVLAGEDKKILKSDVRNDFASSETLKGMVEKATDSEAIAGLDTERYITPNTLRLSVGAIEPGSTYTYLQANTERTSSDTNMTLVKEFQTKRTGNFQVNFDLKSSSLGSAINARIFVNGVAIGTIRSLSSSSYVNFTENLQVKFNDLVQLYYQSVSGTNAIVRNFNMKYDLVVANNSGIIITD